MQCPRLRLSPRRPAALALSAFALLARAEPAVPEAPTSLSEQVQRFADAAAQNLQASAGAKLRLEVSVGALDPRLKLAACARIEPYLPPGTRLWGKAHIGVRCLEGAVRWNVYLPVTVRAYGRALAAAAALPAGTVLAAADLVESEVDLAAEPGNVFGAGQAPALVGRTLARNVAAGSALRGAALKPRQWFEAGETVRITASGAGFAVSSSGEALGPGIEGRSVRVRMEGGRIVSAEPVGDHAVLLPL